MGAALLAAGARGKVSRELRLLGIGVGLSFAARDLYYAGFRRRISPVFLLNGAVQLAFAAAWGVTGVNESRELRRAPEAAFA